MALSDTHKTLLRDALLESTRTADNPTLATFDQLWAAFFEGTAARKVRADGWLTAARTARQATLDAADTIVAARTAAIEAEIAALDDVATNL